MQHPGMNVTMYGNEPGVPIGAPALHFVRNKIILDSVYKSGYLKGRDEDDGRRAMLKRHIIIPVGISFVAAAFIVVCLLVFCTRGRPSLIRKKLAVGAFLLYLTGLVSCDLIDARKGTPTCYVPLPPPNEFHIVEPSPGTGGIDIDLVSGNVVRGVIERREGNEFSYRVEDGSALERQRDDLAALDGAFDEYAEEFELMIREDLPAGRYWIHFFDVDSSGQPDDCAGCRSSYRLNVTNLETER